MPTRLSFEKTKELVLKRAKLYPDLFDEASIKLMSTTMDLDDLAYYVCTRVGKTTWNVEGLSFIISSISKKQ